MTPDRYDQANAVIQATALALPVLLVAAAAGPTAGIALAAGLTCVWLAIRTFARRRA